MNQRDLSHPPTALREAVAAELAAAEQNLPKRQREVMAMREHRGLSYDEIAGAMALDGAAVASLLARARLALRAELRGTRDDGDAVCDERERALRVLARRQDIEPVGADDEDWIRSHLAQCAACTRAHAAMLEASVCYRAGRRQP